MCINFLLNFVPRLIIFSILLLPCSSITYKENNKVETFFSIGTYSDGTMLYQVFFDLDYTDTNILIHRLRSNNDNGLDGKYNK